jgi:hypothetical protein
MPRPGQPVKEKRSSLRCRLLMAKSLPWMTSSIICMMAQEMLLSTIWFNLLGSLSNRLKIGVKQNRGQFIRPLRDNNVRTHPSIVLAIWQL